MDFAICPSCKQSVLDDDAVDCPFCGTSMKAKPGAAKSAAKPATAVAAAPPKPVAPTKAAAKPKPGDESPFDFGENVPTTAIPAGATRTKSRPLEVKCPMCETTGYVPADAAGQAVKCANPKCLVPVFSAPKPEPVKVEAPPPPKPKRSLLMVGVITALVMIAGGVAAWMIAGLPASTAIKAPSAEDLELVKQMSQGQVGGSATKKADIAKTDPQEKVEPKVQAAPAETSMAAWLKLMNDTSLQQRQNRSKPYCRRMTAEAFALTGDLKGSRSQLESLAGVGAEVPFYAIVPLAEIAWQQFEKNDDKGAKKTIDEAFTASAKLPKTGRDRLQSAIVLAAALIAAERDADAAKLLAAHQSADAAAQLAGRNRAVLSFGTYDLAEMDRHQPALPWKYPLTVGVMYELIARKEFGVQPRWINSLGDARMKAEAIAANLDAVVWQYALHGDPPAIEQLQSEAAALPSPGNLLTMSRLGLAFHLAGNTSAAESCLAQASTLAAEIPPPGELTLPEDLKELSSFEPPDVEGSEFRAAAFAEAAFLAAKTGQKDSASAWLTAALAQSRAITARLYDVEQRTKALKSGGIAALRARLKEEWKLKTDNAALVAATELQKNLDQLADAAKRRIELQTQLLTRAVAWSDPLVVWNYIRRGSTDEDAAQADYLIYSHLPTLLAERFRSTGNEEQAEIVVTAWKQLTNDRPQIRLFAHDFSTTTTKSDAKSLSAALAYLKEFSGKPEELDDAVLQAICRLAVQGQEAMALRIIAALKDPVLREECNLLLAGIAARQGKTATVEKQLPDVAQATEKIALLRGLVGGRESKK